MLLLLYLEAKNYRDIVEMDSYFLHSDFAEKPEKLICLSNDSAWKIILKAERVQKDHKVLVLEKDIQVSQKLSTCIYAMKRDLAKTRCENKNMQQGSSSQLSSN